MHRAGLSFPVGLLLVIRASNAQRVPPFPPIPTGLASDSRSVGNSTFTILCEQVDANAISPYVTTYLPTDVQDFDTCMSLCDKYDDTCEISLWDPTSANPCTLLASAPSGTSPAAPTGRCYATKVKGSASVSGAVSAEISGGVLPTPTPLPLSEVIASLSSLNLSLSDATGVSLVDLASATDLSLSDLVTATDLSLSDLATATDSLLSDIATATDSLVSDLATATDSLVSDLATATDTLLSDLDSATETLLSDLASATDISLSDLATATDLSSAISTIVDAAGETSIVEGVIASVTAPVGVSTASVALPLRTNALCGALWPNIPLRECPQGDPKWGSCCSPYGFCGNSSAFCGFGCQQGFGLCAQSSVKPQPIRLSTTLKSSLSLSLSASVSLPPSVSLPSSASVSQVLGPALPSPPAETLWWLPRISASAPSLPAIASPSALVPSAASALGIEFSATPSPMLPNPPVIDLSTSIPATDDVIDTLSAAVTSVEDGLTSILPSADVTDVASIASASLDTALPEITSDLSAPTEIASSAIASLDTALSEITSDLATATDVVSTAVSDIDSDIATATSVASAAVVSLDDTISEVTSDVSILTGVPSATLEAAVSDITSDLLAVTSVASAATASLDSLVSAATSDVSLPTDAISVAPLDTATASLAAVPPALITTLTRLGASIALPPPLINTTPAVSAEASVAATATASASVSVSVSAAVSVAPAVSLPSVSTPVTAVQSAIASVSSLGASVLPAAVAFTSAPRPQGPNPPAIQPSVGRSVSLRAGGLSSAVTFVA
ncbi:hypothetical protein SLS55_007369 [Diplodia seriata]|uniref:Chitin-binding type-1 domain-containing protein n=2 Tax=Diplodia seriata TaxID=420778 RepID=A0ABR3CC27_9PEZI